MKTNIVATICVLVIMAASAPSQDQSFGYRVFDLRYLIGQDVHVPLEAELPLWRVYSQNWEREGRGMGEAQVSIDQVVDMIRETVARESWDEEGCSLNSSWGSVVVKNKPAVLDEVGKFLDWLQTALMRPVTVELYRVPAGKVTQSGALSAAEVKRLIALPGVKTQARLELPSGRTRRVRAGTTVSFLGDYDVEVAQSAQVADPLIMVLHDGLDLRIRTQVTPDGRVCVRVMGRDSSLEKLQLRDADSTWVGRIQFPVVDSQVVMGTGVVEAGGGMLFGAAQGDDDGVFLVRATPRKVADRSPIGGCALIPLGAGTIAQPQAGPLRLGSPARSGESSTQIEDGDREEIRLISPDGVIEMCRTAVDPAGWDEDPYRSLWIINGQLFVKGPDKVLDGVRKLVTGISDSYLKNVGLEVRMGLVSSEDAAGAASGQADLAALAGRLDTKTWISTLAGEDFRQMLGREQAYLKDHDVEIAEKATIADPVVATIFSGIAFQGRISRVGRGRLGLRGQFVIQDLDGEVTAVDGNANDIGVVDVPSTGITEADVTQTLDDGRWTLLRLAPRPGKADILAILVRAR